MRKNYKTLMNNVKELNKWKDIPCSWIRRFNMVKMSVLSKLILHQCNLNQSPGSYFVDSDN